MEPEITVTSPTMGHVEKKKERETLDSPSTPSKAATIREQRNNLLRLATPLLYDPDAEGKNKQKAKPKDDEEDDDDEDEDDDDYDESGSDGDEGAYWSDEDTPRPLSARGDGKPMKTPRKRSESTVSPRSNLQKQPPFLLAPNSPLLSPRKTSSPNSPEVSSTLVPETAADSATASNAVEAEVKVGAVPSSEPVAAPGPADSVVAAAEPLSSAQEPQGSDAPSSSSPIESTDETKEKETKEETPSSQEVPSSSSSSSSVEVPAPTPEAAPEEAPFATVAPPSPVKEAEVDAGTEQLKDEPQKSPRKKRAGDVWTPAKTKTKSEPNMASAVVQPTASTPTKDSTFSVSISVPIAVVSRAETSGGSVMSGGLVFASGRDEGNDEDTRGGSSVQFDAAASDASAGSTKKNATKHKRKRSLRLDDVVGILAETPEKIMAKTKKKKGSLRRDAGSIDETLEAYDVNDGSDPSGEASERDPSTPMKSTMNKKKNSLTKAKTFDPTDLPMVLRHLETEEEDSPARMQQKKKGKSLLNRLLDNKDSDDESEGGDLEEQKIEAERSEQRIRTELEIFRQQRRALLLPEDPSKLDDPSLLMRNKIINEIVQTERDYVDDLETIIQVFQKPMVERGLLNEQQVQMIFSNVSVLYDISLHILQLLERAISDPKHPRLAPCFVKLASFNKMFSDYCNNQRRSSETVQQLERKSTAFRQFIEENMVNPKCQGLPFSSFLIKPIQRICKYPLLLRELIRREPDPEDNQRLVDSLRQIELVVSDINESKRAAENIAKITQIQNLLGKEVEVMQPGRVFVREGFLEEVVTVKNQKGVAKQELAQVYYCLCNDVLIRAEKKKQSKFGTLGKAHKMRLQFPEMMPLYSLVIRSQEDGALLKNCFAIVFRGKKTIICGAPTAEEKELWMEDIKTNSERFNNTTEARTEETQKPGTLGIMPGRSPAVSNNNNNSSSSSSSTDSELSTSSSSKVALPSSSLSSNSNSTSRSSSISVEVRRIKVYLNHKKPEQRIRIVPVDQSLGETSNVNKIISKEFEWNDSTGMQIAYLDEEGEFIEIGPSTTLETILSDAKALVVARPPSCAADETAFPAYAPVYKTLIDEDSSPESPSLVSVASPNLDAAIDKVFLGILEPSSSPLVPEAVSAPAPSE